MLWNYMTSHIIDLTQSRQFYIITYLKIDLFLIIRHLTYLIFLVNLHNHPFESTFLINLHWVGNATDLYYIVSSDIHT